MVVQDGQVMLYNVDGKEVPCQVMTRVTCAADEVNTAIVKLLVNVVGSKEEMMKLIEEGEYAK